jgi:hypothetical protein
MREEKQGDEELHNLHAPQNINKLIITDKMGMTCGKHGGN